MSKPRKPYGPNPPGRLHATMIKVLAAEMSDQQRLARGRRYYNEDAVIDIVIGHGSVTAEVRGSRYEPYVVTMEADGGSGVPRRSELWVSCSCPDDTGTGTDLCKHAVASMFALSDEIAIDPGLLDRWRASRRRPAADGVADVTELNSRRRGDVESDADDTPPDHRAPVIPLRGRGSTESGGEDDDAYTERMPIVDDTAEAIAVLLGAPAGAAPPDFPDPEPVSHASLRDPLLRGVLDDALDHLELRWE
ncbi:MAG: hypothetical protein RIB65_21915 [Ilumatobacter fluminis]|uniref:hypothetical protein n=1 Tax=Ilumatobacter fluminis TaxID=467091 RepID=UPI0032EFFC7E